MTLMLDRNDDTKYDVKFVAKNTKDAAYSNSWFDNLKWLVSAWDTNYDGEWDVVGIHESGNIQPTRFENYKEFMAKK